MTLILFTFAVFISGAFAGAAQKADIKESGQLWCAGWLWALVSHVLGWWIV